MFQCRVKPRMSEASLPLTSAAGRRKLENKSKFVFDPADMVQSHRAPRSSVQGRLARAREAPARSRRSSGHSSTQEVAVEEMVAKLEKEVAKIKPKKEEVEFKVEKEVTKTSVEKVAKTKLEVAEPSKGAMCPCLRPLRLLMCSECGATFPGRVLLECSSHPRCPSSTCPSTPRNFYLQDTATCTSCGLADKGKLLEFDLPAGMDEQLRRR